MKSITHTFFIVTFFALIAINSTQAQYWSALGDGPGDFPRTMIADSNQHLLYTNGYSANNNAVMAWNGETWDTLVNGLYQSTIFSLAIYKGTLLASGNFDMSDSIGNFYLDQHLIRWNGEQWLPFENSNFNDPVMSLISHDSSLYALGTFDSVNSFFFNGITRWDGNSWQEVGDFPIGPPYYLSNQLYGGIFYHDRLYVGGNIYDSTTVGLQRIYRFDGVKWENVGSGIHGSTASVGAFAEYENDLYVGGTFSTAELDPGNFIAKWNDTAWTEVGGGMAGINMTGNGQVHGLFTFDEHLYAVGVFSYAGGIPAQYIAKWNGDFWCGLGDTFDNRIVCGVVYGGDLYIGGGFKIVNGDSVLYTAEWIGGNYVDTCSSPLGMQEIYTSDSNISIFPNPTSTTINLSLPSNQNEILSIFNLLGEKVKEEKVAGRQVTMDVSSLPQGLYLVRMENRVVGKFVKE